MDESVIEEALRAWVRKASGLDDNKIVFAEQDVIRLPIPFITLRLGDLVPLGSADEMKQSFDATRPPGEEVEVTVQGSRSFSLSVQCFGNSDKSARAILSKVQTALSLPSVREGFEAAGISSYEMSPVQNITALLETSFEPRAVMDIGFYCSEEVSERTTYIGSVEVEDEINETTFTIPEEQP